MTDYSKLSDFEINFMVADRLGVEWRQTNPCVINVFSEVQILVGNKWVMFDACNSWADAGPIAEKNRIGTMPSREGKHMAWDTSGGMFGDKQAHSENICRAICIVFLMMDEG